MTEKELKKLSRTDLLEMLIDQSSELQALRERCAAAEEALNKRNMDLNQAGSIAEAALRINGVFDIVIGILKNHDVEMLNSALRSTICNALGASVYAKMAALYVKHDSCITS